MITFGSLAAAVLVIARHGANLQRLLQGTEPRFTVGKKKDEA
jgi:glycerol-3-phosphate acyltransferase PlsY